MTDIVERLRAVAAMDLRTGPILAHTLDTAKEAADEIEQLRAENHATVASCGAAVEHWRAFAVSHERTIEDHVAEIERLRKENEGLRRELLGSLS